MKGKNLLVGSAFYSIGNMIGAGLNMLYQFILMIFLTSEDYGVIQPLMQFSALLLLPLTAYQFALTKHFSSINDELFMETQFIFQNSFKIIFYIICVWILMIPFFQMIFHIKDQYVFILLLLSVCLYIPPTPYISRLQAENKFFIAGLAQIIQGFVRIILGILCVIWFPNIWGAIGGVIFSNLSFALVNIFIYKKELFSKVDKSFVPKPFSQKLLWMSLGSVGLFSFLIYSDTVLVRAFLPEKSGLFASSNLLGKGMIFLTVGVSFVILPMMAKTIHNVKKSLWVGFFCLLGLVLSYCVFFAITGSFLSQILFRDDYVILSEFPRFMPFYNIMFLPYPLIYYFLNYYLVKENMFYPIILCIASLILYIFIFLFHDSINIIASILGIVGYVLLSVVILHACFSHAEGEIHPERMDELSIEHPL